MAELRRSGRERRSVQASLNEAVMQADLREGERTLMRRSRRTPQQEREAGSDDDRSDAEDGEEEDGEEEEEADDSEKRAKRAPRGGRPSAPSSPSSASVRTPMRPVRPRGRPASAASVSKGRSPFARRGASEDVVSPEEAHFSPLWAQLARSTAPVKSAARAFLSAYEAASGSARLQLQADAVNFLLEAAGTVGGLTASEVRALTDDADVDGLRERYEDADADLIVAGEAPVRRIKKFDVRLREFLQRLYADVGVEALREDRLFALLLPSTIIAFSRSVVRAFRQTVSVASQGAMAGLVEQAVRLEADMDTARQHADAAQKRKGRGRDGRLEEAVAELSAALDSVHALLERFVAEVFCHRWRDVDVDIRTQQLSGLSAWTVAYPSYFVQDRFLKYLGWTLHDKAAAVRRAALAGLLALYRAAGTGTLQSLDTFNRRFVKRIIAMAEDVDASVCGLAIDLLTVLLRLGLLGDDEGDHVPVLLWDEDPHVRKAATAFVVTDTFGDRSDEGKTATEEDAAQRHQDDLLQVVQLLHQRCPLMTEGEATDSAGHEHSVPHLRHLLVHSGRLTELREHEQLHAVQVLVDALLPHLPALQDWSALLQLVMAGEEAAGRRRSAGGAKKAKKADDGRGPLSSAVRLSLLYVLLAAARAVHGAAAADEESKARDKDKAAAAEKRAEAASTLSLFLVEHLPALLSTFGALAQHSVVLLQLLPCVQLSQYHSQRRQSAFTSLLSALKKLTAASVDWPVLRECGLAWRRLVKDSDSYAEEASHAVDELALEWSAAIRGLWEDVQRGGAASQDAERAAARELVDDPERALTLLALLKRALALSRPLHLPELSYSSPSLHHVYHELLPTLADADHHQSVVQQELLLALLHVLYADIAWSMCTLDRSAPARAVVERLLVKRNDLCTVVHRLLEHGHGFPVRDAAFELCSDVFVLFSARMQGGVLSDLALNKERVTPLSAAFADYFQQMVDGDDAAARLQQRRIHQRSDDGSRDTQRRDGDGNDDEEKVNELLADLRVQALTAAARVLCFDHSTAAVGSAPRHPLLTALFLAQYLSTDAEVVAVLKHAMHVLRDLSFPSLLQAQRLTLVHLYEHHADAEQLRALANRFALIHGVAHPSFGPLLRPALSYALQDPPGRLPFLDHVVAFVQRASRADAADLQRALSNALALVLEAKGEESALSAAERDSWRALDRLQDALSKKMGQAKLQARRVERIAEEGAGREMEDAGDGEAGAAEASLLLTPCAVHSPRSAASGRSGRSLLSLGLSPVKESGEAEDEEKEKRPTGARKRTRTEQREQRRRRPPHQHEDEDDNEGGAGEQQSEVDIEEAADGGGDGDGEDADSAAVDEQAVGQRKRRKGNVGKSRVAPAQRVRRGR